MTEIHNQKITVSGSFKPDTSFIEYLDNICKCEQLYDVSVTLKTGEKITKRLTRAQILQLFGITEEFLEEHNQ